MARSDTRYSVYPAPKAIEVVGNSAPALNQAIECWAALLARAMADNSRQFEDALEDDEIRFMGKGWQMNEWSLMAKAIKGVHFDPEFANPGQLLATAVEDAHRLESLGVWCLDWGICDSSVIKEEHIDAEVKKTVKKLGNLDYVHAWGVIIAVQWFWEHHDDGIDMEKDPWWTLAFRRQLNRKSSEKSHKAAIRDEQSPGTRRKKKTPSK